ncbi:MAG TPA: Xaa-Pro peptidase family protein [Bryobacteraceae bacterium]|nr:Xaa-Pro peptidase family protein [Bryobacteraceae bacterium]
MDFKQRRALVAAAFLHNKIDALFVTYLPNVRYLSGFTGSNATLLLTSTSSILFTDPRYTLQAEHETTCKVKIIRGPMLPGVLPVIQKSKLRKLGFEKDHILFRSHDLLREKLPLGFQLVATHDLVEAHRIIKSAAEIEQIRQAVRTNSRAFEKTLKSIRPGVRECDLAAALEFQMRRQGADGPSFETIVASGPRAALPHARPSLDPIRANQLLLIDMGATQEGYTSDMTRTVFVGPPSPVWKKAYRAVLDAQLAAIDAIREGVPASKPDRAARNTLKAYKLDTAFTHSTGHGLGLEIHEPPRLGRKEKTILKAGMVITVEPGIYLKGKGGIRIEDTVLVTATGCEILTPTSKELTIV